LERKASIWICHNPESEFHGKICPVEGLNPCLVQGDTSKFCWELTISDCDMPENFEYCDNSSIIEQHNGGNRR